MEYQAAEAACLPANGIRIGVRLAAHLSPRAPVQPSARQFKIGIEQPGRRLPAGTGRVSRSAA